MKRLFAILLAAALLLTLAGCGQRILTIGPFNKKEIAVTTLEEFLNAIGSGRIIRLDAEILLSEAEGGSGYDPPWPGSEILHWEEVFDGWELVINGVKNLTLRCGPQGSLVTGPRYSFVLNFEGCKGITLEGLTAGHTQGGTCAGGVLRFADCENIKINDCDLYGCGTEGLVMENVDGLAMGGGSIYECTFDIMTALKSQNLTFKGCAFRDNGEFTLIQLSNVDGLLFEDCLFENNGDEMSAVFGESWWGGGDSENANITVKGCTFRNNRTDSLSFLDDIVFEDCVFEGNVFDGDSGLYGDWRTRVIDFDYAWAVREGTRDKPGTRLAAVEYAGGLEDLTLAVGAGLPVPVRYGGEKKATGENGEYWAAYEGISGPYWSAAQGALTSFEYLLLPESRKSELITLTPAKAKDNYDTASGGFNYNHGHPPAALADVKAMEAFKDGRKILHSELLATDGTGGRVALFQYENTDEGLLILAYINGDKLITEELTSYIYEGDDGEKEGPYWRADMEENDISEFEAAMLCDTGDGLVLAYWWYGAEGTSRSLMVEDNGEFVTALPASGAWYYDHWDDRFYQSGEFYDDGHGIEDMSDDELVDYLTACVEEAYERTHAARGPLEARVPGGTTGLPDEGECRDVLLGTVSGNKFTAVIHYTIAPSGAIYKFFPDDDEWGLIYRLDAVG